MMRKWQISMSYKKMQLLYKGDLSIVMPKGPSINDVSPKGEGGGYKKFPKRRRLLVDLRRRCLWMVPNNYFFI